MEHWAILIPLFPLAGFLVNGLIGRRLGRIGVGVAASMTVAASFAVSAALLFKLWSLPAADRIFDVRAYSWIHSGKMAVDVGFLVDPLSVVMITMVTGVALLIHIYSIGYMSHDEGFPRFFAYLNLFTASMLILVLADNFLMAFVGWEGVGLCSYLLIGFWFERHPPAAAGMKAFVTNRVGDFGFLLGMILIFLNFGTLKYVDVFAAAPETLAVGGGLVTAITLLLFLGATGKSAQIPLHVWLPDAMEGPTPVSALIHAATMVTAGVYMVARCHVLYQMAPTSMAVVAAIGTATALMAGTIALVQTDIKKVLAYSTVSQLGYMFLAVGVGAYSAGIFHLVSHAFFKGLLFLGAGSVMHALSGELDLRKMGALRSRLPRTYLTFLVGSLALAGVFPFAGFFSKDAILGAALADGRYILWGVGVLAAFLTAVYVFRALFLTFFGENRLDPEVNKHVHESPPVMTIPLMILAVLSTVGGFLGIPLIAGANVMGRFLGPVFASGGEYGLHGGDAGHGGEHGAPEAVHHGVGLELLGMAIALALAVLGVYLAYRLWVRNPERPQQIARSFSPLSVLFNRLWFFEDVYRVMVIGLVRTLSEFLDQAIDVSVIDGIVNGLAQLFRAMGGGLRRLQTGVVQNYAFFMGLGALVILGYLILR